MQKIENKISLKNKNKKSALEETLKKTQKILIVCALFSGKMEHYKVIRLHGLLAYSPTRGIFFSWEQNVCGPKEQRNNKSKIQDSGCLFWGATRFSWAWIPIGVGSQQGVGFL